VKAQDRQKKLHLKANSFANPGSSSVCLFASNKDSEKGADQQSSLNRTVEQSQERLCFDGRGQDEEDPLQEQIMNHRFRPRRKSREIHTKELVNSTYIPHRERALKNA
jgi:hypothetical protein